MFKKAVTAWITIFAVGILILLPHTWWFWMLPHQRSEAVSGFGAALIVLGIWVVASPFIRKGVDESAPSAMPPRPGLFPARPGQVQDWEAKRPQARRDVKVERVLGVWVIVVGTLLNGYAVPVACALSAALSTLK